jgi:hypothetical protein
VTAFGSVLRPFCVSRIRPIVEFDRSCKSLLIKDLAILLNALWPAAYDGIEAPGTSFALFPNPAIWTWQPLAVLTSGDDGRKSPHGVVVRLNQRQTFANSWANCDERSP